MRFVVVALVISACGRIGFDEQQPPGATDLHRGRMAAGLGFTCVAQSDGDAFCWGRGDFHQLGGATTLAPTPIHVNLPAMTRISAGGVGACGIDDSGALWCWGSNLAGELGQGDLVDRVDPIVVPLASKAIDVAVGYTHVCAVLEDTSVWCWGENVDGNVGVDVAARFVMEPTRVFDRAVQIGAGFYHTCALRDDGSIWCWGNNAYGQLGLGATEPNASSTPRKVPNVDAVGLAVGAAHTCVLVAGGRYRCWGSNAEGELGSPDAVDPSGREPTPFPPSELSGLVALTAGTLVTCGLHRDGRMWCWGDNRAGELGNGNRFVSRTPLQVPISGAIAIAAGVHHTCALRADESVTCWGLGSNGQLGDGHLAELAPRSVALPGAATSLAVGSQHACAIVGGEAYCWGEDANLQLGFNQVSDPQIARAEPTLVPGLASLQRLSLGADHSCATVGDGSAVCWGANSSGQLGHGDYLYGKLPAAMMGLTLPVLEIAAGGVFTCVLDSAGVACVGDNYYDELGTTGVQSSPTPVRLALGPVAAIAAGFTHACALENPTGLATCWGHNDYGQAGANTVTVSTPPVAVAGGHTFITIDGGGNHTCAVEMPNDQTWCWGDGRAGQLGTGAVLEVAPAPAMVAGGMTTTQVSAGIDSTCAIEATGNVVCWGANYAGQLGTNDIRAISTPVANGLVASEVHAGSGFACARTLVGDVYCWGDNQSGQIGIGKFSRSLVPVDATFP
ncbi:MAG TPA: hypothetical protein VMZ53_29365 [Kofleriaceae bacterium]|nr:hypothetical protein [Kofleriaceae bacterium]